MKMGPIELSVKKKLNLQKTSYQYFKKKLLAWNEDVNQRAMPWKGEKNPYKIWLSEIMLQQTRVEQGLKYYNKFISKYPTIQSLARAKDDAVLKDWEGLGYYSRCRNLLFTARFICNELNGVFPSEFDDILKLKGVGRYTASAISSFAFNKPYAVVDGNVVRVLSRFLALNQPFVTTFDKNFYQEVADKFLHKKRPSAYNQAIMDFGATVCKPQNPLCTECPVSKKCKALALNQVADFPLKKKKVELKKRYFHYIILHKNKAIFLKKRGEKDIWHSLYEPILIEQKTKPDFLKKQKEVSKKVQKLSHQQLHLRFYIVKDLGKDELNFDISDYEKVSILALKNKAFPKSVFDFFKENHYI